MRYRGRYGSYKRMVTVGDRDTHNLSLMLYADTEPLFYL